MAGASRRFAMRRLRALFLALVLSGLGTVAPEAARNASPVPAGPRLEVLVLEVGNCGICELVRRTIQPLYEQSPNARQAPMRYVDITRIDELKLGLRERVQTVPTIVLLQDGAEVDRITGYMAPDVTLRALARMIAASE